MRSCLRSSLYRLIRADLRALAQREQRGSAHPALQHNMMVRLSTLQGQEGVRETRMSYGLRMSAVVRRHTWTLYAIARPCLRHATGTCPVPRIISRRKRGRHDLERGGRGERALRMRSGRRARGRLGFPASIGAFEFRFSERISRRSTTTYPPLTLNAVTTCTTTSQLLALYALLIHSAPHRLVLARRTPDSIRLDYGSRPAASDPSVGRLKRFSALRSARFRFLPPSPPGERGTRPNPPRP